MGSSARYRKYDFQIHSPRDLSWDGVRPEEAEGEIADLREDYADRFIDKCIKEDLKAISITDHHEGIYLYY